MNTVNHRGVLSLYFVLAFKICVLSIKSSEGCAYGG